MRPGITRSESGGEMKALKKVDYGRQLGSGKMVTNGGRH